MTVPHAARGRIALAVALLALLTAVAILVAPAADAASSRTSVRTKQERRVAKACAHARHAKSAASARHCHRLRARLARARREAAVRRVKLRRPAAPVATAPAPSGTATGAPPAAANTPAPAAPATPAPAPGAADPTATAAAVPAASAAPRLYGAASAFNTRIAASPRVAGNSAAMVGKSLLPYVSSANFANSDWWGIPIVSARASDPLRSVGVFDWGYGADIAQPAVRIPDGASPTLGSDHHLVVLDGDREMDMWVGEQQQDGSWLAGARAALPTTGSGIAGAVSGNAAGFALAAGVIRPEEIAAGRIEHALVFTSPYVRNAFVAPAVHGDGRQADPDAMPMGTRIQLLPATDISKLARPQRIIAQALKDYGAYLVDSSGSIAIRGEASIGRASTGGPADIWSPVGVTDASLKAIPWDRMRAIAP